MSDKWRTGTVKTRMPTPEALVVNLGSRTARIPGQRSSARLAQASTAQRLVAELSPGGYGVNLPLLDEDVSIAGLLRASDHM